MHDPQTLGILCERFKPDQVDQIINFVEQEGGFSPNGELVVVSFFMYAQDAKKDFDSVLLACTSKYKTGWQYMHPEIRGDMDAPSSIGENNRSLLAQLYRELDVPSPS